MSTIWNKYKTLITVIGMIIIFIIITKACEEPIKTTVSTKVDIKKITDSIKKTIIEPNPEIVYIDTTIVKWKKGKSEVKWRDSIVYVEIPSEGTIEAKKFSSTLIANSATAKLSIISTGEVLDVKGTITYPEKTVINTITKTVNNSGGFLYLQSQLSSSPERFAIGLDYQFKNKVIIGTSIDYNTLTKNSSVNVKLGFNIF